MSYVTAFARFWWSFVVGDDWRAAMSVVAGIAVTVLLAHAGVAAWWLLPLVVVAVLFVSLRRATRTAA